MTTTIPTTAPTTMIGGGRVLGQRAPRSNVMLSGGLIESVSEEQPESSIVVDAEGLIVSPGFIDLQINGGFGLDLATDPVDMWQLGQQLPRHGVTGFLPTIISSPAPVTASAMAALRQRPDGYVGAEPLGLHFEGPMLSPVRPGAHPTTGLVAADLDVIGDWSRRSGVALVTIAPELDNAPQVIAELVERGVTVSAGHSEATADEARLGVDAGVTLVTHLFNAMSPLGHRNPNLVGVALADPDLTVSLIVDGVHLAPEIVATAWRAKGSDRVVLITDAVSAMGMGPGTFDLGRSVTIADDNAVRTADGVLAGSILTLDRAVRNLVACTGSEPADALRSVTATPAAVIGQTDRGRLVPGSIADLVLLDAGLEVQATFCRGRPVYVADSARDRIPMELVEGP